MGNQAAASGLQAKCCTPTCCAMCLPEDTFTVPGGKDSGEAYPAHFAASAAVLDGRAAPAEEIAIDDGLERELAQEVDLWRLTGAGSADGGAPFGVSMCARGRGDAEVFKPELAAAARWAGVGVPDSSSSWPGQTSGADAGQASSSAWRPPPPATQSRAVDRGAWTEVASANLDARGARNAGRVAGGTAADATRTALPPHPALEGSPRFEAESSSDEDGFAGFFEHGVELSPDSAPAQAEGQMQSEPDRSVL